MVARPATDLPRGSGWAFEPKADGFRAIATVAEGSVWLQSRQLRSLTRFFPEVVDALGAWFRDVVLDGVICGRRRRVQHVAGRASGERCPSLWTAYLRSVHDGESRQPQGSILGCSLS
jgi:ATP-dependent DNA ligase